MNETRREFEQVMRQFEAYAADPLGCARRWKDSTNGKVVGCVGLHVPEEIVAAAGMLPVLLLEKQGPIVEANAHVQNFMCGYIRSFADQALTGDLDFLDSMVILDSCHVIRMIGDLLRHSAPQLSRIDFLYFPVSLQASGALNYLDSELVSFVKRMEEVAGRSISDEDLSEAIRRHNTNRRLFQSLYSLRRENPGIIDAVQVSNIVKSSMCMPKDEHSALLVELLQALESKRSERRRYSVPIVVSGCLCETCDEILASLEASGATVVDDDLYVGSRYFGTLIDETIPPLQGLANAYMNKIAPCPTVCNTDRNLGDYLAQMARNANAAGVINVIVKYCEAHFYSYLMLRRRLKDLGIPEYMVEKEHDASAEGQIKTRLQGFLEGLR